MRDLELGLDGYNTFQEHAASSTAQLACYIFGVYVYEYECVRPRLTLFIISLSLLWGCTGNLGDPDEVRLAGDNRGPSGTPPGTTFEPVCGPECDAPWSGQRVSRLTHAQWENTVADLLRLESPSGLSNAFTSDINAGVFDTHVGGLKVSGTLWLDYQTAAERLAEQMTASNATLAPIVPESLPDSGDAKVRGFIEHLGTRAYRRPLAQDEVDGFVLLFSEGAELGGAPDSFLSGARIFLQALLQSPDFLYRIELGKEPVGNQVPLTDYEVASRISYALWDTMPDDRLFEAASRGELSRPEVVRAEAERMLASPRAREMLSRFHHQLFLLDELAAVSRDTSEIEGISSSLGRNLVKETELFVDNIVGEKAAGLSALLTSPESFVNDELARLYGLDGDYAEDSFEPVSLEPSERSGLLTRLGFLSAYAHDTESDPIRRGVFVNDRILCSPLPPPPDDATPLPVSTNGTTRERVEAHTGEGTCGEGCHSTYINPIGFAFEHYDGLGRYRTSERDLPVDSAAEYPLKNGSRLSYSDAQDLSQQLAESLQVHECYATHWVEYLSGRGAAPSDTHLIGRLAADSMSGHSVQSLVLEVVSSPAFVSRAVEGSL